MSALPWGGVLAAARLPAGMRGLPSSGIGYSGNDFSGPPIAADPVVSCGVVGDQPEERDRLSGRVEADEACLGGEAPGVRGRQTESKAPIAVAAEKDGLGIGRIRMRRILDASADCLMPFVEDSVEPGSVVHTDGWLLSAAGRQGVPA